MTPSNWKISKLGDLCNVTAGGTPSRSVPNYWEGGDVPWVKISDMLQGSILSTDECITRIGLANSPAKLLPKGTLLLSIFATIGRTAILGIDAATNQAIVALTPRRENIINLAFFRQFLDFKAASLSSISRGAAQANINGTILKGLEVPVPDLPEQCRIAAILDQAEALRAKRRTTLTKLDTLAQSIFIEMFGDQVRNGMAWPLDQLCSYIVDGPQNGLYKPSDQYGEGTPILRIDGFYAGRLTNPDSLKRVRLSTAEIRTYKLNEGDIVINRVNSPEYLGKCALIPAMKEQIVFESNMMRLSVDRSRLNPIYLVAALQGPSIKAQIQTRAKHAINQSSINQKDVQGFVLPIPPVEIQNKFAERLSEVESAAKIHKSSALGLDALFASLQHRAFRGEL